MLKRGGRKRENLGKKQIPNYNDRKKFSRIQYPEIFSLSIITQVISFHGFKYLASNCLLDITVCGCVLSCFSCVRLFVTPWTVTCQASLSVGILQARILEWVAMPCWEDLLNKGTEPRSHISPALASSFFTTSGTWKDHLTSILCMHFKPTWTKQNSRFPSSLPAPQNTHIPQSSSHDNRWKFHSCSCLGQKTWSLSLIFHIQPIIKTCQLYLQKLSQYFHLLPPTTTTICI